jgi:glycerol-1-phosphate dehydrogenase [NAD(P)+]
MFKIEPLKLLGQRFECGCGREHYIPTESLVYDKQGLRRLPEILGNYSPSRHVSIVCDERTYQAAGRAAEAALHYSCNWRCDVYMLADGPDGKPVCDDKTFAKLMDELTESEIYLAVGSGVVNDLTKWAAFERKRPYAVVPTAASMNGYAAANIAAILDNVKSVVYGAGPVAVVTEPDIIADAPFEMTAAGLGDAIAKPISVADWLMNHRLLGEYFCGACSEILSDIECAYFDNPAGIGQRDGKAIKALYDALIYSGIAMTIVGTSAPASGGEHMLSHTLDMMALKDGLSHDLHGRQVGIGTITAAALYERLFAIDEPTIAEWPGRIDEQFWGGLRDGVAKEFDAKKPLMARIAEQISDGQLWHGLLAELKLRTRPAKQIKHCLAGASAAHSFEHIEITKDRLRDAILHMHEIRKRPTVVDLAWQVGVLPAAADEIIDECLC